MSGSEFRVWDEDSEKMIYGVGIDPSGIPYSIPDDAEDYTQFNYYLNGIKMQFTGLKDRNGKKIYEGDIIDFTYWWFDGNVAESHLIGEVVYLPEFMSFGLRGVKNADWIRHIGGDDGSTDTAPFATWTFDEADFEVIGNIYENPTLLDGK